MKKSPEQIFDELLVLRFRSGDEKAMNLLIKRWHSKIKRQVVRHTYEQEVAEDIAQEVWEAVLKGIYQLREPALFGIWALRIASRKAVDWIRSVQKERSLEIEAQEETMTEPTDEIELLRRGLKLLPDEQRQILNLHYLEKNSVVEISVILDIPAGTVKSRLHAARKRLKELLITVR